MDEQELKELMAQLMEAGVRPQLCDTPVPVSVSGAHCGLPTEIGDESIDDYILIPKVLVGQHPEMFVPAVGDSMTDAGYEDGDLLRVRFGVVPQDGDNVLALIDGACTVKTLFTDEEGTVWLVPQNERYDAIELTEGMDVRMLGVVKGVEKANVRSSSRSLLTAIRRTKNKRRAAVQLREEEIDLRILRISEMVKHARQWYAVFRAMADNGVSADQELPAFCERVRQLLPDHGHLPDARELGRMAVQSFAKPVTMWQENNAPVSGSRYRDYLSIALEMSRLLGTKEL